MARRSQSFQTAAARRKADPVQWDIETADEGTVTIRLRASIVLIDFADLIDALNADAPTVDDAGVALSPSRGAYAKRLSVFAAMEPFIVDDDLPVFRKIQPEIDGGLLNVLSNELVEVYSGGNPTEPPSLPDGSSETSSGSTDGAPPEVSTP